MQINNITDYLKTTDTQGNSLMSVQGRETATTKSVGASDFLREIKVDSVNYGKNDIANDQALCGMADGESADEALLQMKNQAVLTSETTSNDDLKEMEKQGYDPKSMDAKDYVNVADQIKLQLAKAGADVDIMGGLSETDIENISGSKEYATVMENALKAEDLPADAETIQNGVQAFQKVDQLAETAGQDTNNANTSGQGGTNAEAAGANASDVKLSTGAIKYLLKNQALPTIENVYKAEFATSSIDEGQINGSLPEGLETQVTDRLQSMGITVDSESLNRAAWMIDNQIPITEENVTLLNDYLNNSMDLSKENILNQMVTAVAEGNQPQDAYLLAGYSLHDQAEALVAETQSITDQDVNEAVAAGLPLTIDNLSAIHNGQTLADPTETGTDRSELSQKKSLAEIMASPSAVNSTGSLSYTQTTTVTISIEIELQQVNARKQLEEIRYSMTVEASYTMMKNGIDVGATELSDLIDQLSDMQNQLQQIMLGSTKSDQENMLTLDGSTLNTGSAANSLAEQRLSLFNQVNSTVSSIKDLPALLLGRIPDIKEATLSSIYSAGSTYMSSADGQALAATRYETMMTEVRSDLGDSIKKAFSNSMSDILDGLDLEDTEANERAVRILGYNNTEITRESVLRVREADSYVQDTFKALTPKTVLDMIRTDVNPLDLAMEELTDKIDQIKATDETANDTEKFSKFLYRMDQTAGMSEEERDSFLGIYRLMHQVNATDGAAIGMLLQQGSDVTMRNLMTAVRSEKHENQEYTIDDSTGFFAGFQKDTLSITDQIEMAFQSSRMQDAEDQATPYKMMEIGQDSIMEMSPDALAEAFEGTEEPDYIDDAVLNQERAELRQAYAAEDEIYSALDRWDISTSADNLMAMKALYTDRRNVFKNITKPHTNLDGSVVDINDIDIDALLQESLEDYGEAVKTPEAMAEAEHQLEEIAENVLRDALIADGNASIDLKALKLQQSQMSIFTQMAKQETYNLPIMVADENGNMTLKIVRGTEDKGLVDILFSNDTVGAIGASFRYSNGQVDGQITCDSGDSADILSENAGILADAIQEETNLTVSLSFKRVASIDESSIYKETQVDFEVRKSSDAISEATEQDQISTKKLYGIARAFVETLENL